MKVVKIVVCGDVNSGKTSLMRRFVDNDYSDNKKPTIAVDYSIYDDQINKCTVHNWDVSGEMRYANMVCVSAAGAQAVLFCFDLCSHRSFESIEVVWKPLLATTFAIGNTDVALYLVGTKLDMADAQRRQVTSQEALSYAVESGMRYFEVSAKTGQFVAQSFQALVQMAVFNQPSISIIGDGGYDHDDAEQLLDFDAPLTATTTTATAATAKNSCWNCCF